MRTEKGFYGDHGFMRLSTASDREMSPCWKLSITQSSIQQGWTQTFPHVVSRSSLNDGFSKSGGLDCSNYQPSTWGFMGSNVYECQRAEMWFWLPMWEHQSRHIYVVHIDTCLVFLPSFCWLFAICYSSGNCFINSSQETWNWIAMLARQVKGQHWASMSISLTILELAVGNTTLKTSMVQSWKGTKARLETNQIQLKWKTMAACVFLLLFHVKN